MSVIPRWRRSIEYYHFLGFFRYRPARLPVGAGSVRHLFSPLCLCVSLYRLCFHYNLVGWWCDPSWQGDYFQLVGHGPQCSPLADCVTVLRLAQLCSEYLASMLSGRFAMVWFHAIRYCNLASLLSSLELSSSSCFFVSSHSRSLLVHLKCDQT